MRDSSRRVLAAVLAFGCGCSGGSDNSGSEAIPALPERTATSEQAAPEAEDIQRPPIPVAQSFEGLCRLVAFAPVTVQPILEADSRRQLLRYLAENDPIHREGDSRTDEVKVWVCVDETGGVQNTAIAETSGNEEIDAFAEAALANLRFVPAEFEGEQVPTWISLPVVLGPG